MALARPVVIAAVPTNQTTIMLAMDVSGSMCSTDIPPSRLQAAEAAAIKFIESQGSGTQIGIVAFAGFAEIVQTPTNDHQVLVDALRSLATGRRTAIGSGILDAIDAIAEIDPNVAQELDRGLARPAAGAGAQGRLRPGDHRGAHRRRQQRRLPADRRRAAGRRPRRPGLHDRLRDRERRRAGPRLCSVPRRPRAEPAVGAAAGSAAAAASGAASTRRRSSRSRT